MDVRPPLVSDAEPAVLVQPRQSAFDDPSVDAQPASVFSVPLRKDGLDASVAKDSSGAVRNHTPGPPAPRRASSGDDLGTRRWEESHRPTEEVELRRGGSPR